MAGVILQVSEEIMDTFLQTHHFNTTFFTPETLALVTLFWVLLLGYIYWMFAVPGARQWFEEEQEQERRRGEEEEVEGADMDWRGMEEFSWGVVLVGICVCVLDVI
jgi:hypothetical protein